MGQKLLPRWLQHGMPIWDPKIVPNVAILGPQLGPSWGHVGPKNRFGAVQVGKMELKFDAQNRSLFFIVFGRELGF